MALSKDAILAADDRPTETVDCPEWGGHVLVRALSARDLEIFDSSTLKTEVKDGKSVQVVDMEHFRAKLLLACLVDEQGNRLFTDAADLAALSAKSAAVIGRIYDAAKKLNGIGQSIEDVKGN